MCSRGSIYDTDRRGHDTHCLSCHDSTYRNHAITRLLCVCVCVFLSSSFSFFLSFFPLPSRHEKADQNEFPEPTVVTTNSELQHVFVSKRSRVSPCWRACAKALVGNGQVSAELTGTALQSTVACVIRFLPWCFFIICGYLLTSYPAMCKTKQKERDADIYIYI